MHLHKPVKFNFTSLETVTPLRISSQAMHKTLCIAITQQKAITTLEIHFLAGSYKLHASFVFTMLKITFPQTL